ncbi:MAG: hypothetical protein VB817_06760, partial [Pirellulaceae bacterium]
MMRLLCLGTVLLLISPLSADGPRDNDPTTVRRVPRLGVDVPEEDVTKLNKGLDELAGMIQRVQQQGDQQATSLLPDV